MATTQLVAMTGSGSIRSCPAFSAGTKPRARGAAVCCRYGQNADATARSNSGSQQQEAARMGRRSVLLSLSAASPLLAFGAVAPAPAQAEVLPLKEYLDGPDEFRLLVPEGWATGEGQAEGAKFGGSTGARRALAWYPEGDIDSTSLSIVVTNVGADFTKLGSFGTASAFGENLVASMDRRFTSRAAWGRNKEPIQEAELLAAKERNSLYYIDYNLKKPGEDEKRVFLTAVALGFNGRYNRLYTVTAQCKQKDFGKLGDTLQRTIDSFKPPVPVV